MASGEQPNGMLTPMTVGEARTRLDSTLSAALQANQANRLDEAQRLVRQVLEIDPGCLPAKLLLGVLYAKRNEAARATALLNEVLDADPSSFDALMWLSTLARRRNDLSEAITYGRKALEVRPSEAHAYNNLGLCLLDSSRSFEAIAYFEKAVSLRPESSRFIHNLGLALQRRGRDAEAAAAFRRALALSSGSLDSLLSLSESLLNQNDVTGAENLARRAVDLAPESAPAHLILAGALIENNRPKDAERHLAKGMALDPTDDHTLLIGIRQQSLGRIEQAQECFRRSIEREPRQGYAYLYLFQNQRASANDRPLIDQMYNVARDGDLPPTELSALHYGLGKALEDLGEYEGAMRHYDKANTLAFEMKFGEQEFDRADCARHVDRMISELTPEKLSEVAASPTESAVPIVIVGMMRSGTTLLEQILSSHADIRAAGEQRFWAVNWQKAFPPPENAFHPRRAAQLGREYLGTLMTLHPDAPRITDKMPGNYLVAGLIQYALPNARIIHVRRHPVDTCLSIYATFNRSHVEFAHRRENIVFAYKQYQRLMEHWRAILPPDRFMEVDYEAVVSDRVWVMRDVVRFLGLEWDEALLHHEKNVRAVTTPSAWQVRQPIYSTSVERWRKFEPWLGEFCELL